MGIRQRAHDLVPHAPVKAGGMQQQKTWRMSHGPSLETGKSGAACAEAAFGWFPPHRQALSKSVGGRSRGGPAAGRINAGYRYGSEFLAQNAGRGLAYAR